MFRGILRRPGSMTRADSSSQTASARCIEEKYGAGRFLTSLTGESVRVYPMPVWLGHRAEARQDAVSPPRAASLPRPRELLRPGRRASMSRAASLIPPRLRESPDSGEVDVLGQVDYLDVWNHERFLTRLQRDPFTDDDARALAGFQI